LSGAGFCIAFAQRDLVARSYDVAVVPQPRSHIMNGSLERERLT
jgi:hypothetical protein